MRDEITILNANRLIRSREEFEAFEAALAEIAADPDPQDLPDLFLVLDDGCEESEVMFGLVHFLETFERKPRLQVFLDVVPEMMTQAPDWVRVLHYRILNNDEAREYYKQLLRSAPAIQQQVVRPLLEEIAQNKKPLLAARAQAVLDDSKG